MISISVLFFLFCTVNIAHTDMDDKILWRFNANISGTIKKMIQLFFDVKLQKDTAVLLSIICAADALMKIIK